jgi:hypothetical protein
MRSLKISTPYQKLLHCKIPNRWAEYIENELVERSIHLCRSSTTVETIWNKHSKYTIGDNIKMDLQEVNYRHRIDWSGNHTLRIIVACSSINLVSAKVERVTTHKSDIQFHRLQTLPKYPQCNTFISWATVDYPQSIQWHGVRRADMYFVKQCHLTTHCRMFYPVIGQRWSQLIYTVTSVQPIS